LTGTRSMQNGLAFLSRERNEDHQPPTRKGTNSPIKGRSSSYWGGKHPPPPLPSPQKRSEGMLPSHPLKRGATEKIVNITFGKDGFGLPDFFVGGGCKFPNPIPFHWAEKGQLSRAAKGASVLFYLSAWKRKKKKRTSIMKKNRQRRDITPSCLLGRRTILEKGGPHAIGVKGNNRRRKKSGLWRRVVGSYRLHWPEGKTCGSGKPARAVRGEAFSRMKKGEKKNAKKSNCYSTAPSKEKKRKRRGLPPLQQPTTGKMLFPGQKFFGKKKKESICEHQKKTHRGAPPHGTIVESKERKEKSPSITGGRR